MTHDNIAALTAVDEHQVMIAEEDDNIYGEGKVKEKTRQKHILTLALIHWLEGG